MRPSVLYLAAQSVLTTAWWIMLLALPDTRRWFRPAAESDTMLIAFWLADLVCLAAGSLVGAILVHRGDTRRTAALWFTSGAVTYAALYCVALVILTGEAWAGAILMVPAAAITLAIARSVRAP